jgi:hypothetical protein
MHRIIGWSVLIMIVVGAMPAAAQSAPPLPTAAVAPANGILPNYNSVAIGEIGSLEGNAFVARADDSSAAWYNPAGLTLAKQSTVSGSGGAFQSVAVTPEGFKKSGTSFRIIPTATSFTVKDLFGSKKWAGGLSLAVVNAWAQSVDGQRTFTNTAASERVMYSSLSEMYS